MSNLILNQKNQFVSFKTARLCFDEAPKGDQELSPESAKNIPAEHLKNPAEVEAKFKDAGVRVVNRGNEQLTQFRSLNRTDGVAVEKQGKNVDISTTSTLDSVDSVLRTISFVSPVAFAAYSLLISENISPNRPKINPLLALENNTRLDTSVNAIVEAIKAGLQGKTFSNQIEMQTAVADIVNNSGSLKYNGHIRRLAGQKIVLNYGDSTMEISFAHPSQDLPQQWGAYDVTIRHSGVKNKK